MALVPTLTAALLVVGSAPATPASAATEATIPRFVEVAAASGVSHTYAGNWTYFVRGGVATFDCDHDGDSDLFVAGGADPSALFRNESSGTLKFREVNAPSVRWPRPSGQVGG